MHYAGLWFPVWENHPPASVSHYLLVSCGPDSEVGCLVVRQEGKRWMPLFVPCLRTGEDATKIRKFKFQYFRIQKQKDHILHRTSGYTV